MRQCNIVEIPQSTTMTWQLGVRTPPEKPRYVLVPIQSRSQCISIRSWQCGKYECCPGQYKVSTLRYKC